MKRNTNLCKYDFKHNDLKDEGKSESFSFHFYCSAVKYFTQMLGQEEGKIGHVTELEISERATGKTLTDPGPPEVYTSNVKLLKEALAGNKPKKGKKGKKGKKKKKK